MDVLAYKVWALAAIVAVTLAGACLPYWLKRRAAGRHGSQAVLAISHSLAGGVFVTAALLHLLPDACENLALSKVMLLVATGVIFADLVESMALPNSQDYVRAAFEKDAQLVYVPKQAYVDRGETMSAALLSGQNSRHESVHAERSQHASHCPDEHVHVDPAATADSILHGHGVHHHHIQVGGSGALSWVVCCLLSVHAAVTGAALGMTTTVRSTIILAVVIIAHKGVESFAVAFNFAEAVPSRSTIVALIVYGLMTPVGAIAAVTAKAVISSSSSLLVQSVLEAISAGSFLYVGMMHLQDKTCSRLGWAFTKVLPEVFGAGLMVVVSFWI
ncbi:ZIP Zinc transporter [Plasmodiophora brassicae]|uniref:Uncharacterized protein n=1 Tax=Plasmodiophora brassicae TaxID=37360 RepID=A0A0G4J6T7_PLABS|nr:hypothetical protein PBRA_003035 [Plasmodiophora brassicae]SPQ95510.1 unnamed protein product [Plasmodiophora brassicae]